MISTHIRFHDTTIEAMQHFYNKSLRIDGLMVYLAYYKTIPSLTAIHNVDEEKIRNFLLMEQKDEILQLYCKKFHKEKTKPMQIESSIFILKNNLIIDLGYKSADVIYGSGLEVLADEWTEKLAIFRFKKKRERRTDKISLLTQTREGLETIDLKLKKPKLLLDENYNDDLLPIHTIVINNFRKQKNSGIVLLHGKPGTGKSTYIRYLIYQLNKKVIFMPPSIAANLDSPHFTNFLIENENSIFIIEDAEQLITSREVNHNSSISMLLNLTDGLLGESLGIQIIATFNTPISNIDKALLRKGRLLALYEFKELEKEKANLLSKNLGFNINFNSPMILTAIYNQGEIDFEQSKKINTIGFMASVNNTN